MDLMFCLEWNPVGDVSLAFLGNCVRNSNILFSREYLILYLIDLVAFQRLLLSVASKKNALSNQCYSRRARQFLFIFKRSGVVMFRINIKFLLLDCSTHCSYTEMHILLRRKPKVIMHIMQSDSFYF